ncbi:MAG: hypothetical protein KC609_06000 [Myxococcales bacterium]|nr:hypothetical protein [Myxococcales bacterium]
MKQQTTALAFTLTVLTLVALSSVTCRKSAPTTRNTGTTISDKRQKLLGTWVLDVERTMANDPDLKEASQEKRDFVRRTAGALSMTFETSTYTTGPILARYETYRYRVTRESGDSLTLSAVRVYADKHVGKRPLRFTVRYEDGDHFRVESTRGSRTLTSYFKRKARR